MNILSHFSARDLLGNVVELSNFSNQVLLVVNTASKCGYSGQYAELEFLYRRFFLFGFTILAFPCNQFGLQEPGNSQQIAEFCEIKYQITFPIFEKINVNGKNTHPFYKFLKEESPGLLGTKAIKWNFTKFLLDRNANVIGRWSPLVRPNFLIEEIKKLL